MLTLESSEFLTKTLPHLASDPIYRKLFETLAELDCDTRNKLLNQPEGTVPFEVAEELSLSQYQTVKTLITMSLENPYYPKMMVRSIDWQLSREKGIKKCSTM